MATLAGFYKDKSDSLTALVSGLKTQISTKQKDLKTAQDGYAAKFSEYMAAKDEIDSLHKQIAAAQMPSDVEALATQLQAKLLVLRSKNVAKLDAATALNTARCSLDSLQQQLKRNEQVLQVVAAKLDDANTRKARHDSWDSVISAGVFTDLQTRAQELKTQMTQTGDTTDEDIKTIRVAHKRIDEDIPSDLRTRASARRVRVNDSIKISQGLLESFQDAYGDFHETAYGLGGGVAKQQIQFARKEAVAQEFIQSGQRYLDQAIGLLQQIQDSTALTTAEHTEINDHTLATNAGTALGDEDTLDTKQQAVDEAQAAYELAVANAKIADPDVDLTTVQAVSDAQTALTNATNERNSAKSAYEGEKAKLDAWEITVPDHIWQNLIAYDRAMEFLDSLINTNPSTLVSDMQAAEDALVTALQNEDKRDRSNGDVEDAMDKQQCKITFAKSSRNAWVFSAVRGDN